MRTIEQSFEVSGKSSQNLPHYDIKRGPLAPDLAEKFLEFDVPMANRIVHYEPLFHSLRKVLKQFPKWLKPYDKTKKAHLDVCAKLHLLTQHPLSDPPAL